MERSNLQGKHMTTHDDKSLDQFRKQHPSLLSCVHNDQAEVALQAHGNLLYADLLKEREELMRSCRHTPGA